MDKRSFLKLSAKGGGVISIFLFFRVVVGFGTQVILARMLEPSLFGIVAFATTVAMFFNSFTNLHGDKYVIHQKSDPIHVINVAFTLEMIAALVFFVVIFFSSPFIMDALGKGEYTNYVRFLALAFFYNPLSLPRCLLERELSFFKSKLPFLIAQIISAAIGITLAYKGYGIWSLLWWRLLVFIGEVIILWVLFPYKLRFSLDMDIANRMLKFSWPIIISTFLAFFYYNIDYFIIGQVFNDGGSQLGFYWLAFQAGAYTLIFREVLYQLLFPMFSRMEDESLKILIFEKLTFAVAGFFLILTVIAILFGHEIITLIYGNKWAPSVFPFQIIFIVILMRAISSNMGYLLYSRGQTKPEMITTIIYSILLPPLAYYATIGYGINGTAVAVLVVQIITVVYAYQKYIKPLTGKNVFYYFLWPWVISALTLCMVYVSNYYGLALLSKFGILVALMILGYITIFKYVVLDILSGLKVMRA